MKSTQHIMIEIKNLTLQRGLKVLLNQASATITPRQRIGLIGKNGTGKSSLFALVKNDITHDSGEISIPKNWKLAAVSQETPALDISALDYVLQGDADLQHFQAALAQRCGQSRFLAESFCIQSVAPNNRARLGWHRCVWQVRRRKV